MCMYSLICIGAKVIKWRIESLFSNCNGNNQIFIWGRKWAITLTLHDTQNLTAIKNGNLTKSKTIKLFKRKYRGKYLWPFDMERFPIQEVKSIKQREEKNQWNELHENFKCLLFKGHKLKENICNTYLTKAYIQNHGLQHARLSCTSLSPGVCSNSCSLCQWCHPTISSSVGSFSFPEPFTASGLLMLFASGGQSIGASASASVLPINSQGWFPSGLVWSPCCPRYFSSSTIQKYQFFSKLEKKK